MEVVNATRNRVAPAPMAPPTEQAPVADPSPATYHGVGGEQSPHPDDSDEDPANAPDEETEVGSDVDVVIRLGEHSPRTAAPLDEGTSTPACQPNSAHGQFTGD